MKDNEIDYRRCINLAIENAKLRMSFVNELDKESIISEYKEWINEEFNYQSILLLREDPII